MSGHSKWHSIRHKKAAIDSKRGKIFTKLIKEISISAKLGGGDAEGNPRLRIAINKAKESNMPQDNIERAIKKGTGELDGVAYEEFVYEAYGPEGIAIIMDIMTDNRNRTAAEVRSLLSKNGGNLGESGCVAWNFEKKGVFTIPKENRSEEQMLELVMEIGAEDMEEEEDAFLVYSSFEEYENVLKALEAKKIKTESSEIERIPKTTVKLSDEKTQKVLNLLELIEDHDDIQSVSSNLDLKD